LCGRCYAHLRGEEAEGEREKRRRRKQGARGGRGGRRREVNKVRRERGGKDSVPITTMQFSVMGITE
jgi:hypothetical protein